MRPVCPICKTVFDSSHSLVARVSSAEVITYCSRECAEVSKSTHGSSTGLALSANIRKRVILASTAIMVCGMIVAAIQVVSPSVSSTASASANSEPREFFVEDIPQNTAPGTAGAVQQKISSLTLRKAAIAELQTQLAKGSTRFQRLAAIALSRLSRVDGTSYSQATAVLQNLLTQENSELSRVDIAFGLAMSGDATGHSYLLGGLNNKRRDVRIDTARRLLQLGDNAGQKTLLQMLSVRSHRIGAAAVLAQLGHKKGLDILRKTLRDSSASSEDKMRAAVGLGRAGDDSGKALLHSILTDKKYVVDAAGALAALGDPAALPALVRQLKLTSLRVSAARSLARLGQVQHLEPLAAALTNADAEGRIAAAEAILLLTGPAKTPIPLHVER